MGFNDDWERSGRGRELQFCATDEEVQGWLLRGLPDEYSPYTLVGSDVIQRHRHAFETVPFEYPIHNLTSFLHGAIKPRHLAFIRSHKLTSTSWDASQGLYDAWCSLHGMVLLDHGKVRNDIHEVSRIAVVERIRNKVTGEQVVHEGYMRVFSALKRVISESLKYSALIPQGDGSSIESRTIRMSECAVGLASEGTRYEVTPGRRLR